MYLKSYKELIVWQKAMQLVKVIFLLTESFPKSELFGLVSQMRRAAISIPSNIAEGYGRHSSKEYSQFCSVANGSALELETQLLLSGDLGFGDTQKREDALLLLEEVLKMLRVMIQKIELSAKR
ncbi:MAG: four helix bundle protein [bacterium]|nr:four helix bundle protein [bacterium]